MPLKVVRDSPPESPTSISIFVVIIRSLSRASRSNDEDEARWWLSSLSEGVRVNGIFIFLEESDKPLDNYTLDALDRNAIEMLSELGKWLERPARVIFVTQTFGGYILKKAMRIAHDNEPYRQVLDALSAIIFIAVPHCEDQEGFAKSLVACAASEVDCPYKSSTVRFMTSDTYIDAMKKLCRDFPTLFFGPVVSFCESKPTARKKKHWYNSLKPKLLVGEEMTKLREPQKVIVLDLDHHELAAEPRKYSVFADRLKSQVREILKDTAAALDNAATLGGVERDFDYDASARRIPNKTARSKRTSTKASFFPHAAHIPCLVIRPYQRNPRFCGRADVLAWMTDVLGPKRVAQGTQAKAALIGMGGIGKTQTALAFAFDSFDSEHGFRVVLWAHAETRAKLAQSFSDFDRELGLSKGIISNQTDSRERVKRWLEHTDIPWLLVFDNAEVMKEDNPLEEFWPSGRRGSVLVTARDEAALGQFTGKVERMKKLEKKDAVDLMLNLTTKDNTADNRANAEKICASTDFLPLAISSAARVVVTGHYSFDDYLVEYNNMDLIRKSEPLRGPEAPYPFSLATVWRTHFRELEKEEEFLLNVVAFLDSEGIEEKLLFKGLEQSTAWKHPALKRHKRFVEVKEDLCKRGLIYRNENLKKIWMHRLVQDYCVVRMDRETFQEAFDHAFEVVRNIWPVPERHNRHNREAWAVQQEVINHVVSLAGHYRDSLDLEDDEDGTHGRLVSGRGLAELFYHGGWYYYERGNFQSAHPLLRDAERYCDEHPEESEVVLADIFGAYGSMDSESNDMISCQTNFQKQLDYLLRAITKGQVQRPTVREALAYGGLANATMGLKQYGEAEPLYRRCLELWKDCPGDPSIYIPHLAVCLTLQNKTDEAERILLDCIKEREEKYGVRDRESFRTGIIYFALGNTYIRQQKFDEAYSTHLFALEMLEETLGDTHHRFADACYKVGWHMKRKRQFPEARERLEKALGVYQKEKIYCNEAARTNFVLAQVAEELGEWRKASEYKDRANRLRREVTKDPGLDGGSEQDYDELIMFWSR